MSSLFPYISVGNAKSTSPQLASPVNPEGQVLVQAVPGWEEKFAWWKLQRRARLRDSRKVSTDALRVVVGGLLKFWWVCLCQKSVATTEVCHFVAHRCWTVWLSLNHRFLHFSSSLSLFFLFVEKPTALSWFPFLLHPPITLILILVFSSQHHTF